MREFFRVKCVDIQIAVVGAYPYPGGICYGQRKFFNFTLMGTGFAEKRFLMLIDVIIRTDIGRRRPAP